MTGLRVGPKGQIVIEKGIREALGVRPGAVASQRLVGDHVEIRFYPAEHDLPLRGILARETKQRVSEEEWGAAVGRAWEAALVDHAPTLWEVAENTPPPREDD